MITVYIIIFLWLYQFELIIIKLPNKKYKGIYLLLAPLIHIAVLFVYGFKFYVKSNWEEIKEFE